MENIKKFRGEKGWTQKALAEQIKIKRASVVYLEQAKCHSTSRSTTQSLCKAFNVSPCKLYGLDNLRYLPESKEDFDELISLLKEEFKQWV